MLNGGSERISSCLTYIREGVWRLEKPVLVKCHLCGATAQSAFAYALFSEREKYLGVIYRGVCKECLDQYIDRIKTARRGRAEGLIWLAMFLPAGVLLALLAQQAAFGRPDMRLSRLRSCC
jgi:hypothetical protein